MGGIGGDSMGGGSIVADSDGSIVAGIADFAFGIDPFMNFLAMPLYVFVSPAYMLALQASFAIHI